DFLPQPDVANQLSFAWPGSLIEHFRADRFFAIGHEPMEISQGGRFVWKTIQLRRVAQMPFAELVTVVTPRSQLRLVNLPRLAEPQRILPLVDVPPDSQAARVKSGDDGGARRRAIRHGHEHL